MAYHVKGIKAYNNTIASILPLHTPLTSGEELSLFFFFFESSHVVYQITGMKHRTSCKLKYIFKKLAVWLQMSITLT